jgi:hypothetical protein
MKNVEGSGDVRDACCVLRAACYGERHGERVLVSVLQEQAGVHIAHGE